MLMKMRNRFVRMRRRRGRAKRVDVLREFVYVDETSVYSLLASLNGPTPTEYTDTNARSRKTTKKRSAKTTVKGIEFGGGVDREDTISSSSQILRKSSIQSAFRDLHQMKLSAPLIDANRALKTWLPASTDMASIVEDARYDGMVVTEPSLRRGSVIEAEVELEADPIFEPPWV